VWQLEQGDIELTGSALSQAAEDINNDYKGRIVTKLADVKKALADQLQQQLRTILPVSVREDVCTAIVDSIPSMQALSNQVAGSQHAEPSEETLNKQITFKKPYQSLNGTTLHKLIDDHVFVHKDGQLRTPAETKAKFGEVAKKKLGKQIQDMRKEARAQLPGLRQFIADAKAQGFYPRATQALQIAFDVTEAIAKGRNVYSHTTKEGYKIPGISATHDKRDDKTESIQRLESSILLDVWRNRPRYLQPEQAAQDKKDQVFDSQPASRSRPQRILVDGWPSPGGSAIIDIQEKMKFLADASDRRYIAEQLLKQDDGRAELYRKLTGNPPPTQDFNPKKQVQLDDRWAPLGTSEHPLTCGELLKNPGPLIDHKGKIRDEAGIKEKLGELQTEAVREERQKIEEAATKELGPHMEQLRAVQPRAEKNPDLGMADVGNDLRPLVEIERLISQGDFKKATEVPLRGEKPAKSGPTATGKSAPSPTVQTQPAQKQTKNQRDWAAIVAARERLKQAQENLQKSLKAAFRQEYKQTLDQVKADNPVSPQPYAPAMMAFQRMRDRGADQVYGGYVVNAKLKLDLAEFAGQQCELDVEKATAQLPDDYHALPKTGKPSCIDLIQKRPDLACAVIACAAAVARDFDKPTKAQKLLEQARLFPEVSKDDEQLRQLATALCGGKSTQQAKAACYAHFAKLANQMQPVYTEVQLPPAAREVGLLVDIGGATFTDIPLVEESEGSDPHDAAEAAQEQMAPGIMKPISVGTEKSLEMPTASGKLGFSEVQFMEPGSSIMESFSAPDSWSGSPSEQAANEEARTAPLELEGGAAAEGEGEAASAEGGEAAAEEGPAAEKSETGGAAQEGEAEAAADVNAAAEGEEGAAAESPSQEVASTDPEQEEAAVGSSPQQESSAEPVEEAVAPASPKGSGSEAEKAAPNVERSPESSPVPETPQQSGSKIIQAQASAAEAKQESEGSKGLEPVSPEEGRTETPSGATPRHEQLSVRKRLSMVLRGAGSTFGNLLLGRTAEFPHAFETLMTGILGKPYSSVDTRDSTYSPVQDAIEPGTPETPPSPLAEAAAGEGGEAAAEGEARAEEDGTVAAPAGQAGSTAEDASGSADADEESKTGADDTEHEGGATEEDEGSKKEEESEKQDESKEEVPLKNEGLVSRGLTFLTTQARRGFSWVGGLFGMTDPGVPPKVAKPAAAPKPSAKPGQPGPGAAAPGANQISPPPKYTPAAQQLTEIGMFGSGASTQAESLGGVPKPPSGPHKAADGIRGMNPWR
jgi:hypothetical protein